MMIPIHSHKLSMIQLQHHLLHSYLSAQEIHARIEERLTNNIGLALSSNHDFLFSGTLTSQGFTITPIQKGRIYPMPRLHGTYHTTEQGTDIRVICKPGLSSTLDIMMWCIVGLVISIYATASYGIFATGFMIVPLLYIGLQFWLLNKEIRMGIKLLSDLLRHKKHAK